MAKFKVLRKFSSTKPHEIGDIVDFDGGNTQKLVNARYLEPIAEAAHEAVPETKPAAPRETGRPRKEPPPAR